MPMGYIIKFLNLGAPFTVYLKIRHSLALKCHPSQGRCNLRCVPTMQMPEHCPGPPF